MSSTAATAARSVRRLAAWVDPVALRRARLTVVPRTRARAPRLPFVALVSAILIGGVVGLLMFNTSMQQAAFVENQLSVQASNLAARQQALESDIQRLNDPQTIAAKAQAQGMVIPPDPAVLHVPAGKVDGVPTPATADNTPQLWKHQPKPTAPVVAAGTGDAPKHHHKKKASAR